MALPIVSEGRNMLPVYYRLSSNSVPHENSHKENAEVHAVAMIVLQRINRRRLLTPRPC